MGKKYIARNNTDNQWLYASGHCDELEPRMYTSKGEAFEATVHNWTNFMYNEGLDPDYTIYELDFEAGTIKEVQ